jgi:hypothetical protein
VGTSAPTDEYLRHAAEPEPLPEDIRS